LRLPGPDWLAPAKLNLFLHVVGRREDGYHQLQTAFTLIDRCDRVRLRVREDGRIDRVNVVPGVPPDKDLAVRAALLLQEASGTAQGVDIEIEKSIPMGGGLGGGSSDAATALMALDRLWGTGFGPEALAEIAGTLGADVPYFLYGRPAWAEGIGDRLTPLEIEPRSYLVLTPPGGVSTAEIFAAPELTRDTEPLKMEDFSARPPVKRFTNDLESVVTARHPVVRQHLEWLRERAAHARMTGSGACVFAEFERREDAEAVMRELPGSMQGFVAQGLMEHPLREL
jgi:4-diphosphocytidyl-2-C-methyl-D-erythritol kinase